MAMSYIANLDSGGSYPYPPVTSPPASGPVKVLVDFGPTIGQQWAYSGQVNGTTTFYVVRRDPTLGEVLSAT